VVVCYYKYKGLKVFLEAVCVFLRNGGINMAMVKTPMTYLLEPDKDMLPKENIKRITHMLSQLLLDNNEYTVEVTFKNREPMDPMDFADSIANVRNIAQQIKADPELCKKVNSLKD